ncbi:uncharacterized protein LOC113775220 [Coffea eugenioides]|uniref:Uncharacterized protein n=1 Tax=Coffea arabica TaxID=13443 RepID=A0A6P6SU12_COFAR|nr:uncharacterized protein LOC113694576 [Coffea arabica]XP_027175805.1 uncharacterized protein LOC113775220 [Coffea eugenioides]
MPQVDLETLVSACAGGGTERKITCETLADDLSENDDVAVRDADVPQDFPPESFWLSKDAELDWFDRNAFFERKESTKGISNFAYLNQNPNSNSNSQRFSVKVRKTSLLGLPKTQKANYIETAKRRNNKPANVKLFPKPSSSVGKAPVSGVEPSSPKVSCIGRVRSKRGRRRSSGKREMSLDKSRSLGDKRKKGFCSRVLSIFKSGSHDRKPFRREVEEITEESTVEETPRTSVTVRMREFPVGVEPASEPPGLGGLKKFASGRRSGSWSTEDFDVALSNSLVADGPAKRS